MLLYKNKFPIFLFFSLSVSNIQAQESHSTYPDTYSQISLMLSGQDSVDFKKAVFLVENAYQDSKLNESNFDSAIHFFASICRGLAASGNVVYPEKDIEKASAQCAAFLFMTDTTSILMNNEKVVPHPPFEYNFADFAGQKDWSNMFVSTLIETNKGNCHSLPYLYKMIMDEMGYESHLALSPNHIYIKAQNKRVGWYNIELTCGDFPTDAWYVASGYIHTDAIRNGIYMKALSEKESVTLCLVDLAQGYQAKFGIEDGSFILKCCDTALSYFPNYINALLLKAETLTALRKQSMPDSEEDKQLLAQMNEMYSTIHKLGYRKMPEGMYSNWIKRMKTEDIDYRMKSIMIDKNEIQQN